MRELISIIIPVYNAEKYISSCIESVLHQTYNEIEVILIDDGSKDQSASICDDYARKDDRIKVVHKVNGGVSSARNEGIKLAKGKYVCFVDSDDWLEPNGIDLLYSELQRANADLVSASYTFFTKHEKCQKSNCERVYENKDIVLNIIEIVKNSHGSVWGKIFKKDIINTLELFFHTDMPMGEDSLFVISYLQGCNKISFIKESIYNYNRIVKYSAVKKYYEKYGEYNQIIFEQLVNIIRNSAIGKSEMEKCISMVANRMCCLSIFYYVENCIFNKQLETTIKDIALYYQNALNEVYYDESVEDLISYDMFSLIVRRNISMFLKTWKKEMRHNQLNKYIILKLRIFQRKMR